MRRPLAIPAAALALLSVTACEGTTNCTPTRTEARAATKVNVGALSRSAVIDATLTANGEPLSGLTLEFEVLDDDRAVYRADGSTGGNGIARHDLKRADADALLGIVRGDAFRASFDGNATYCASSDEAAFSAVRA